jgi:hypothetical protein
MLLGTELPSIGNSIAGGDERPSDESVAAYTELAKSNAALDQLLTDAKAVVATAQDTFCRNDAYREIAVRAQGAIGLAAHPNRLLITTVLYCSLPPCDGCEAHVTGPVMSQTVPSIVTFMTYPAIRRGTHPMEWSDFLRVQPTNRRAMVTGSHVMDSTAPPPAGPMFESQVPAPRVTLALPVLTLFCETCEGDRRFAGVKVPGTQIEGAWRPAPADESFDRCCLRYGCRDCGRRWVEYAVVVFRPKGVGGPAVLAVKTGQVPPYGPHVPPRLQRLVQGDRELLMQGRRAEGLGLGLGAFTYYRRVVENQKNALIRAIRRAAEKLEAPDSLLQKLDAARDNWRFTDAVDSIKDAIPDRLRLPGGHNPLVLLHNALSGGIHNLSDEECLRRARDVRVVLDALARRLAEVTVEDQELRDAIAGLQEPMPPEQG